MSTNGPSRAVHPGPKWTLDPWDRYRERKDALAPDDPVREKLDGLEFEIERDSPWPRGRSWGLRDDGQTNRYWVIRSSPEHSLPLVEIVFEVWNQKVRPIGFRVVDPFSSGGSSMSLP